MRSLSKNNVTLVKILEPGFIKDEYASLESDHNPSLAKLDVWVKDQLVSNP